jgi:hypothetical protein
MFITGQSYLTTILRIITWGLLILNILVLLALPLILTQIYQNPELIVQLDRSYEQAGPDLHLESEFPPDLPADSYPFYLVFLYASGLGTATVLFQGLRILKRIERGEPFCAPQAGSFRWLAIAFFWLALVFLVKIFAYNTLLTIFCCLLFFFFSLVCLILADVFRQAWLVKSENEMTI